MFLYEHSFRAYSIQGRNHNIFLGVTLDCKTLPERIHYGNGVCGNVVMGVVDTFGH